MFAVNLYLIDRAFGGHEEGGWYFDCGEPVLHPLNRVFEHYADAEKYFHDECLPAEKELNQGRPSISSVLSQGRYHFRIGSEFEVPAPFPSERPHYE
jgi:hypothetical protein